MRQVLAVLSLILPITPFIILMLSNPLVSLVLIAVIISIGSLGF